MKKIQKVMGQILLCAMMLFTIFPQLNVPVEVNAKSNLVNIASRSEVTVPENEGAIPNMFDGKAQTIWSPATQAGWPATVTFKLPADNMKPVEKIVIRFLVENESQEDWSMDVQLGYYVNSVTSDELVAKKVKGHMLKDAFEFEFEEPTNISHALVTMENPKDGTAVGGFWPQIAEMEIYVAEDAQEEDLTNLAPNATVTSCGGSYGNAGNLVDNNYDSLYVFYNGGMSSIKGEAWVQADLGKDTDVHSLEIAFEHKQSDADQFLFTYSIYGMKKDDTEWTKLVASDTANRTNEAVKEYLLGVDGKSVRLSKVKVVIESITNVGGDPWPAIAELKIFGKEEEVQDIDNLAWKKPTHTNTNQATSQKITDGNINSSWSGAYYPGYVDIDLEENYNISDIEVYLPTTGYSQYDIYTSMDGRDFTKLLTKDNTESTPAEGDRYQVDVEARIVRVYMNYQSNGSNAIINEVRVLGKPSGTPVQNKAEVEIEDFEDSKYNVDITDEMTIKEVQGIVTRQLGAQYVDWFDFKLGENPNGNSYDFFTLSENNGKIVITGNNGVSLATGLNHYLKYYLNVHISQVGNQVKMPSAIVSLGGETVTRETKLPVRYAYNYCTLSYSMAFWGEEEWRNELDWLALNGVTHVLDATAQEEVWRRFLMKSGYSEAEAKDFIAGPAYYAWAYMANMSGYGGPVHDSWFVDRTELARKNQLTMRTLGMQPILQGYSGMVPVDIETKDPSTKGVVIGQGGWCSFTRPSMLNATSQAFRTYAQRFYETQKEVFGDVADYYATDPYHEGGNPGGVPANVVSENVLSAMMKADKDAVWVVQSWGSNPTSGLLQGVAPNKEHVLILDLYAEKEPRWENWNGRREFTDTPWVYCMLNNFGGRLGLHGHIDNFVNAIPRAINETTYMKGIGITPEASVNNPVLYDLFFETIWAEDADNMEAIDLDTWFKDYTTRRYGAESENAYQAMLILNETVYNPALNMKGQGAPESVVNARPRENINAASTWGNSVIDYDKKDLEEAARLLLEDYDVLKDSAGYQYDLANVLEQVLSNSAQDYHKAMVRAYQSENLEQFTTLSNKFLSLIDLVDQVTGTQEYFMVGRWIEQAKGLASNADEFTKELYEFNARSLITTWGSINQANSGGLSDYSNRQWAGLTKDYYKPRWERWIDDRIEELNGGEKRSITSAEWFKMEWDWVNSNNTYETEPNGLDLSVLGEEILSDYTVDSIPKDPAADDKNDLSVDNWEVTAGSEQSTTGGEGPAMNLIDNNQSTIWHSSWDGTDMSNLWVNIHMPQSTAVDGLRYLPRTTGGENGIITGYVIEVSNDNGKTYQKVAEGTWTRSRDWKLVKFESVEATDVRLKVTSSATDSSSKNYGSGAEIRLTSEQKEADKAALNAAIALLELYKEEAYTPNSWVAFTAVLNEAKAVAAKEDATQEEVNAALESLANLTDVLVKRANTEALNKAIAEAEAKLASEDITNYTDATVEALTKAVAEAKKVDANATQEQVDQATANVKKAMKALVYKAADYTEVDKAIAKAEALNPEDYEDFSAVTKAIEAVERDLDITHQKEVDAMAKAIEDAIANLKEKPEEIPVDKTELAEVIAEASQLKKEEYTEATWDVFEKTLAEAKEVLADEEATEEMVKEAVAELEKAIGQLEKKPTIEPKPDPDPEKPGEGNEGETTPDTGDTTNVTTLFVMFVVAGGVLALSNRNKIVKFLSKK